PRGEPAERAALLAGVFDHRRIIGAVEQGKARNARIVCAEFERKWRRAIYLAGLFAEVVQLFLKRKCVEVRHLSLEPIFRALREVPLANRRWKRYAVSPLPRLDLAKRGLRDDGLLAEQGEGGRVVTQLRLVHDSLSKRPHDPAGRSSTSRQYVGTA